MVSTTDGPVQADRNYKWMDGYVWKELAPNCCCSFTDPESLAYVLDSSLPTAGTIVTSFFLNVALITLANEAVGCEKDQDGAFDDCDKLLGGMFSPNNINIVISFGASLFAALSMPIFGSIVDHTSYRKDMGVWSLLVLLISALLQIMISADTYIIVAVLQFINLFMGLVHAVVYSAPTQEILVKHRTYAAFTMFGSELLLLGVLIVVVGAAQLGELDAARLALVLSSCYYVLAAYVSYLRGFRGRPPSHDVPEGTSPITAGLRKLWRTIISISSSHPYLLRYIISVCFIDGTITVFPPIAMNYLLVQLEMKNHAMIVVGLLLVVSFIFSPCAVLASRRIASTYGDVYAGMPILVSATIYMAIATAIASLLMVDKGDAVWAFVFAVIWGFGMAFYYSLEKATYYFITPVGLNAEFSGIAMFAGKIISWMPLLSFFLFYEKLKTMQYGLAFMSVFFMVGAGLLLSIDVSKARDQALNVPVGGVASTEDKETELVKGNQIAVSSDS